jgi:hypothetical protein
MARTSARRLLDGWEAVRGQPLPLRAATLAALAADAAPATVMQWPIARRDRALFDLRADLFGDTVDAVTACPLCGEALELQVALSALRPADVREAAGRWRTLRLGRQRIRWRPPDSADLLAVSVLATVPEVRAALLARCIDADDPAVRERAAARLPAEPTDVRVDLACPSCAARWQAPFDIAAFTWREVEAWALRTLADVHVIAGAYGWTEDEILRLSPGRRDAYVGMIR